MDARKKEEDPEESIRSLLRPSLSTRRAPQKIPNARKRPIPIETALGCPIPIFSIMYIE